MPERTFATVPGGPQRVTCRWEGLSFKNFQVLVDGQEIGRFDDKDALSRGGTFRLPEGGELFVQFAQSFGGGELKLTLNGSPLPGSDADPTQARKSAAGLVYFLGGLNLLVGIAATAGVEFLVNLGLGPITAGLGALYLVLAVFTGRGSRAALAVAMAIFGIDGVLSLVSVVSAGGHLPVGALVFRVSILMGLGRTFAAMGNAPAPAVAAQPYR